MTLLEKSDDVRAAAVSPAAARPSPVTSPPCEGNFVSGANLINGKKRSISSKDKIGVTGTELNYNQLGGETGYKNAFGCDPVS